MTDPGRLLIDSTFLIRVSRGDHRAVSYLSRVSSLRLVGTTSINVAEVLRRAHERERALWQQLWSIMNVWPVTFADAEDAGSRLYALSRTGIQGQVTDALIAAVARRVDATVVTDDVKDFERLEVPVVRPY
jgi:predicted nucleic acid-binding protein